MIIFILVVVGLVGLLAPLGRRALAREAAVVLRINPDTERWTRAMEDLRRSFQKMGTTRRDR